MIHRQQIAAQSMGSQTEAVQNWVDQPGEAEIIRDTLTNAMQSPFPVSSVVQVKTRQVPHPFSVDSPQNGVTRVRRSLVMLREARCS